MTDPMNDTVFSVDHTRIRRHHSKLWAANDVSFAAVGGLSGPAGLTAGKVAAVVAAIGLPLILVFGIPWFVLLIIVLAVAAVVYMVAARNSGAGLNAEERLRLHWNYIRKQPKTLSGFGEDEEPFELEWRLILWRPAPTGNGKDVQP